MFIFILPVLVPQQTFVPMARVVTRSPVTPISALLHFLKTPVIQLGKPLLIIAQADQEFLQSIQAADISSATISKEIQVRLLYRGLTQGKLSMALYKTIAKDTITLRDLLTPNIGISTIWSHNFSASLDTPLVSWPITKAIGSLYLTFR